MSSPCFMQHLPECSFAPSITVAAWAPTSLMLLVMREPIYCSPGARARASVCAHARACLPPASATSEKKPWRDAHKLGRVSVSAKNQ